MKIHYEEIIKELKQQDRFYKFTEEELVKHIKDIFECYNYLMENCVLENLSLFYIGTIKPSKAYVKNYKRTMDNGIIRLSEEKEKSFNDSYNKFIEDGNK